MPLLPMDNQAINTPDAIKNAKQNEQEELKLSFVARIVIVLIQSYQYLISPLLGPRCRFYPSCSSYAASAFKQHNFFKACWLSVRRVSKCHPGNPGGVDELPPSTKHTCNH